MQNADMDIVTIALLGALPILVVVAGLYDLTTMRIPNWISGSLILAFFPAALAVAIPWGLVALHVGVAVLALLIGMGLFAARIIGGGDAKLMAAACLWLGTAGSSDFILWTALFGGGFTLALLVARKSLSPTFAGGPPWIVKLMQDKGDIPYGVAIAGGALMAFPSSTLMSLLPAG
jgi:prepilin peptidase CpaA